MKSNKISALCLAILLAISLIPISAFSAGSSPYITGIVSNAKGLWGEEYLDQYIKTAVWVTNDYTPSMSYQKDSLATTFVEYNKSFYLEFYPPVGSYDLVIETPGAITRVVKTYISADYYSINVGEKPLLYGDVNHDFVINNTDLELVNNSLGRYFSEMSSFAGGSPFPWECDFNNDWVIDDSDLEVIYENMGKSYLDYGERWEYSGTIPNPPENKDGLVGHWALDSSDITDLSGNNHHGVISGDPQVVQGYNGNALYFDGIDDSIDLGNWFNYQEVTVSMWIKPEQMQNNAHADIIDCSHDNTNGWVIQSSNSWESKYRFYASPDIYLDPEQWQYLVYTHTSDKDKVYINNILVAESDSRPFTYDISKKLTVGNWWQSGRNWKGSMQELKIYNKALSQEEIISPEVPETYTVTFVMADIGNGPETMTQTVTSGSTATPPQNITCNPGYTFIGWDKEFSNITSDLTVNAVFIENSAFIASIEFVDPVIYTNMTVDDIRALLPEGFLQAKLSDNLTVAVPITDEWQVNIIDDKVYLTTILKYQGTSFMFDRIITTTQAPVLSSNANLANLEYVVWIGEEEIRFYLEDSVEGWKMDDNGNKYYDIYLDGFPYGAIVDLACTDSENAEIYIFDATFEYNEDTDSYDGGYIKIVAEDGTECYYYIRLNLSLVEENPYIIEVVDFSEPAFSPDVPFEAIYLLLPQTLKVKLSNNSIIDLDIGDIWCVMMNGGRISAFCHIEYNGKVFVFETPINYIEQPPVLSGDATLSSFKYSLVGETYTNVAGWNSSHTGEQNYTVNLTSKPQNFYISATASDENATITVVQPTMIYDGSKQAFDGGYVLVTAQDGTTSRFSLGVKYNVTYTITFIASGNVVGSFDVLAGESVESPIAPQKDGYTFIGWDKFLGSVTKNMTVNAIYKAIEVPKIVEVYDPQLAKIPENATNIEAILPQTLTVRMSDGTESVKAVEWSYTRYYDSYYSGDVYCFYGIIDGYFYVMYESHVEINKNYPDFTLRGAASVIDNSIRLTPDVNYISGSAWYNNPVTGDFEVSFDYIDGFNDGADGFAFMFYLDKNYVSGDGGSLGFNGSNGYGIEFDSYINYHDPSYNHVALIKHDVSNHLKTVSTNKMEDGQWHNAKIIVANKSILVKIDGETVLSYVGDFEINGNDFGFSASTGASKNEHWIKNITVNQYDKTEFHDITEISSINDISIDLGTAFEALNLPEEVNVSYYGSEEEVSVISIPVLWNKDEYNPNLEGVQTITATLSQAELLENNLSNTENMAVSVKVTVINPIKYYTVTFIADDVVIGTQTVEEGSNATAPENIPQKAGYTFTGWNKDFTNITSDLTVNAVFAEIPLEITGILDNFTIPEIPYNATETQITTLLPQTVTAIMSNGTRTENVEKAVTWTWTKAGNIYTFTGTIEDYSFTRTANAESQSITTYIDFEERGGIVGTTLTIPIIMSQNDIQTGSFNIKYDNTVLKAVGVVKGTGLGTATFNSNISFIPEEKREDPDYISDLVRVNWLGANTSNGDIICTVAFRIMSDSVTQTTFSIVDADFYRNDLQPVNCIVGTGSIYIKTLYALTVFKQNDKTILRDLQNGILSISTNIYNSSGNQKNVSVAIAAYTKENKLVSLIHNVYDSKNGISTDAEKAINIDDSIYKVKVFYWDSLENMTPYVRYWEICKNVDKQ